MAEKAWYFPSSSGNYIAPSGEYRIKIWYTDDEAYSHDMESGIIFLGDLKIPLEVDPQGSQFRFSSMKATFENIDDEFEIEELLNESRQNEIFVDIYRNDSLFFQGLVDFSKNEKTDWYFGAYDLLKYRNISLTFVDRIAYFWRNNTTLADLSYEEETTTIGDLFTSMKEMINVENLSFDEFFTFEEYSGVEYNIADLYLAGQGSATLVSVFLKKFVVAFGCFIFTMNGALHVNARITGEDYAVDPDDVINIEILERAESIQNVQVKATLNTPIGFQSNTRLVNIIEAQGSLSGQNNLDLSIDGDGILNKIFSLTSISLSDPEFGDFFLFDLIDADIDFFVLGVESGDALYQSDITLDPYWFFIKRVVSEHDILFYEGVDGLYEDYEYQLITSFGRRYKIYFSTTLAYQNYSTFFLTSPDIARLSLKGLDWDLIKKYVIAGWKWRVRDATYSFMKNNVTFEMRAVEESPDEPDVVIGELLSGGVVS